MDVLREKLDQMNIKSQVTGRAKHFYSIFRKMYTQNKTIDELYDLYAFRVIVDNIADCYNVLGHIHDLFNPIPGRFKDYISTPKPNMYQSLHTTVIGSQGIPFEVQIRTWEMHQTAEYGIAAHWKYKEKRGEASELDEKLQWLRGVMDVQSENSTPQEFYESLKFDLYSGQVFVFTPKGDVVTLPEGSNPIDFAYNVHTAIGNKCVGAKINNKMVPLETKLNTGDYVEIITSPTSKGPSRDWLRFVKNVAGEIENQSVL